MAQLMVRLLGPPRLSRDEALVRFERRKSLALLAYLAVTQKTHSRHSLAALLWPEEADARARASLRTTLSDLRRVLGVGLLQTEGDEVRLADAGCLVADVSRFRSAVASCRTHGHGPDQSCAECVQPLTEADRLYRGDLLAGFHLGDSPEFDDWQSFEGESLRGELAWVLERLVRCHSSLGDFQSASACARRWLSLDPLHEPAHRAIMLVHAWAGQPSAGLRQYASCARVLEDELGSAVSAETERLAEAIRAGSLPALPRLLPGPSSRSGGPGIATSGRPSIYRRVFVGREAELAVLRSAFDDAVAGRGGVVAVAGEPGIGKSALCGQLADYVALRGGRALIGCCYEQGSLSQPYLAFSEAIRGYALERGARELRQELGDGAAQVARIVPEIWRRLGPGVPALPVEEQGHYRLLRATADLLAAVAAGQPLALVLEDLQDADLGTLAMLGYLARSLARSRLLFVVTYRDVEVTPDTPLSATLAELRRLPSFLRLALRGLAREEVMHMVAALTGSGMQGPVAGVVFDRTEGNPLFVQELVRYLEEQGHGAMWAASTDAAPVPDGLREVIRRRLRRLGPECERLLPIAAVIGREFDASVLQQLAEAPLEELCTGLERAQRAAVIEEQIGVVGAGSYRFTHGFYRRVLYDDIVAPRRSHVHQQVGRALERLYRDALPEHSAMLAEHFAHAADRADRAKAVTYGELAAAHACTLSAYAEAARLLQQALQVQEVLDPLDLGRRCDLQLLHGEALNEAGQPRRVADDIAPAAFALAEAMGDQGRASRASTMATTAMYLYGGFTIRSTAEYALWADRQCHYSPPGTLARVSAEAALGRMPMRQVIEYLRRELASASSTNDTGLWWDLAYHWLASVRGPRQGDETLTLAEEVLAGMSGRGPRALAYDSILRHHWAGEQAAEVLLVHGHREEAEELWAVLRRVAAESGQTHARLWSMEADAVRAVMDGRAGDALAIDKRLRAMAEEAQLAGFAVHILDGPRERAQMLQGMPLDDDHALESTLPQRHALCLASAGRAAEAREVLDAILSADPGLGSEEDHAPEECRVDLLQTATVAEHLPLVRKLLPFLAGCGGHTTGDYLPACTGRHLGAAALLLRRPDEALAYYEQALAVAMRIRFRPEIALTRLQMAELLHEHRAERRAEVIAHLDFAIPEFRAMNMAPGLERALRLSQACMSSSLEHHAMSGWP